MAEQITREQVLDALRTVQEPELHKDLVTLNMVKEISVDGGKVKVQVMLTTPACPLKKKISDDVEAAIRRIPGVTEVEVDLDSTVPAARAQNKQSIEGIKNIVAVASGKGGVGKSTMATLLALCLRHEGARVGLLDADIYGPSIPRMMGILDERPQPSPNEKKILPVEVAGIKVMSMGFLVSGEQAVIWRGPMVHKAIQEFMYNVDWGQLDYLLVDLPPGTGDAQLTLSQSIPLAGIVAVTTPQEVAFTIAAKVISMFREMKVPPLGVIENMAYFQCGHCDEQTRIFGDGGGLEMARRMGVPLIGSLPLDPLLVKGADIGELRALIEGDTPLAAKIRKIARDVAARVSLTAYMSCGIAPAASRAAEEALA
ncbi:MAG: Mrp/NBP35 family ATP-binding protein [Armatimonadetes bacterium]|nr:Mrp/NBP35 family ATP-binding protein [Armatimonadota bacterium]